MTDLTVIILVGKEELHIRRCLEKLAPLEPRQIFIVESQHGDRTHEIAIETGKRLGYISTPTPILYTYFHAWPGLQSSQFNWALDNLPIKGEWILRLDADEYLTDESIAWLREKVKVGDEGNQRIGREILALEFTLERKFCGGVIRHATNGIKMVRMFRRGHARYSEGQMDERLEIRGISKKEEVLSVPVVFYDDNLNTMAWWREKHRDYAKREARQALESMKSGVWTDPRKSSYYRLPPYLRAFAYFCIRYFLKLGILDGYAGWMWNFWQGLWYRLLVDREISRLVR